MATNITADVSLNISKLIDFYGIKSFSDFAERLGVTKQLVGNWKKRNTYDVNKIVETFPDVSTIWLLTGEGPMLKSPTPAKRMQEVEILGAQEELYIPVPFLDMGVQAGWLMDFNNPEPKAQDDVEMRYVSPEFRFGTHIVAVVRGDSMDDGTKRSISEGDEILLRLVDDFEWNGLAILNNLYVIVTQEGTVLKQITKLERSENGYINCHSFNSLYPDYRIELSEVRWFFKVCRVVNRRISI